MSTRLRFALLAAAFAAATSPALAARDDGGTTGVFATGAGNRAIAMGGAFTAVADGPWGWTWNPGGLAWLPRASAEALQGAPDAIGARETQAALAVPDWRWGAVALSWRQFGVDGIDGRDARGLPTGAFADRETELGLAYGHTVAPALGLGVAIKMRRQTLADRSGGGVGADAGATLHLSELAADPAPWWRDLVLGLRLSNAIRPAVRLDRDEVSEPAVWSGGVAWVHGSARSRVTLAADLEHVAGGLARARLGGEYSLLGALDLRAGWDGDAFSAGTALGWRGMDVSYTWRDNPLGAEQRMSLGWRFGRSVGESRDLAAAASERELQHRLQAAFDADMANRARSLLEGAQQALAAGDLEGAWDKASVLSAMAPNRPESGQLMAKVLVARASQLEAAQDWDGARVEYEKALALQPDAPAAVRGAARCRDESDRLARRNTEQRRLHDSVLRAIAAGDPIAARSWVDSLRARGVADSTIAPLLLRLERVTSVQLDARLEQFQRLLQSGMFDEASAALERARVLDPKAPAVTRAREMLARAKPAPRAAAIPAALPVVSEQAKREADQLYQSGLEAQRAGNDDLAVRSWELAIVKNPGDARVRELLKREYQTRGLDAFSAGRLSAAVEQWQRALQLDPKDARTRSYLDRAQEHLVRSAELGVGQ